MLPTSDRFLADMHADVGPTSAWFRADVNAITGQTSKIERPMFTRYSRCRSCIDFDSGPLFVLISGRHRLDGLLLSLLLNDFESKKENFSFENYIYDQEYFVRLKYMTKNVLQYILIICTALINFYCITFIHIYFFNIFRIM